MAVRAALVGKGVGEYKVIQDAPIPEIQPDQMVCKTNSVAINPADAKTIDHSPNPGIGGYDFSGTVIAVGASVTKFQPGNRVFGFVHGLNADNPHSGAFSDYVISTADLCCKMPSSMSFNESCTLALAFGTVGYAIFRQLGIAMPGAEVGDRPEYALVAGGNTSSGRMAIQFLKLYVLSVYRSQQCLVPPFLRYFVDRVLSPSSPAAPAQMPL